MSKYAIIVSGGHQYRVEEDQPVVLERLPGLETGASVQFEQVLLVHDAEGEVIGRPYVPGARVRGKVLASFKGKKIQGFKYKPKKRYRRRWGHRAQFTELLIQEIQR